MDMSENSKFDSEKATAAHQSSSLSSDWHANLVSMSSSSCSPVVMAESFNTNPWSHPFSSLISSFTHIIPGNYHPGLSHLPADAAFIERAARFSCFSGGNLSGFVNSFSPPPMLTQYANSSMDAVGNQLQKTDFIRTEAKDVFFPGGGGSNNGNQEANKNSANEISDSSPNDLQGKKRKRTDQNTEVDNSHQSSQSSLPDAEAKPKVEENNPKPGGENVKDNAEAPKVDYVHIRARRGQATNSHSLAERVRREKISERMKYLQDLVPGCSKVTGKAVMLDEIINYVQSLQRQVEFLSMKLAAVNPRLDYNLEAFLTKDVFQTHAVSSSLNGLSKEMTYPSLHRSQQGFFQAGNSHDPSDSLFKVTSCQLSNTIGYKDHTVQVHNHWSQDRPNLMEMVYEANPPLDVQELTNKPHEDFSI